MSTFESTALNLIGAIDTLIDETPMLVWNPDFEKREITSRLCVLSPETNSFVRVARGCSRREMSFLLAFVAPCTEAEVEKQQLRFDSLQPLLSANIDNAFVESIEHVVHLSQELEDKHNLTSSFIRFGLVGTPTLGQALDINSVSMYHPDTGQDSLPTTADYIGQLFLRTGSTNPGLYEAATTTGSWTKL